MFFVVSVETCRPRICKAVRQVALRLLEMNEELAECTEQALRFLSLREHNRGELVLKLKKKGFDANVIEQAVVFLEEDGLLDESRYAEQFVRSSNKRHPEGKKVVCLRLLSKGTNRRVAKEVTDRIYTDEYTQEMAEKAENLFRVKYSKKFRDEDEIEKAVRTALVRAGFNLSKFRYMD